MLSQKVGGKFSEHIFASRLALWRRGDTEDTAFETARDECTMTTQALLVIATWLISSRKKLDKRLFANAGLAALLAHMATVEFSIAEVLNSLLSEFATACQDDADSSGWCRHDCDLLRALRRLAAAPAHDAIVEGLSILASFGGCGCQCILDVTIDLTDCLAAHIDG